MVRIFAVLSIGLATGYGVRDYLEPSREMRMMSLFASICEPYVLAGEADMSQLVDIRVPGWNAGDPDTGALVDIGSDGKQRICRITDLLDPLQEAEKLRLIASADEWAQHSLVDLPRHDLAEEYAWPVALIFGKVRDHVPGDVQFTVFELGAVNGPGVFMTLRKIVQGEAT